MLQGIHVQLMIGPTIPAPVPGPIIDALERIEVTHRDQGRSGFSLAFRVEGNAPAGVAAAALAASPLFSVFNRIILTIIINGMPHALMDGIITSQDLEPGGQPGSLLLTLTGEDISLMLDREEKSVEHPGLDETLIAYRIIGSYPEYGLIPAVFPPVFIDPPLPTERIPVQQTTDLRYLQALAARHAYVCYITPGPAPFTNTCYWGPPIRAGIPQPALSVNMGTHSNVDSISFQHNALEAEMVSGRVQDRTTNQVFPVQTFASTRIPLASLPDWAIHRRHIRSTRLRQQGLNFPQAMARAQAETDRSMDRVVTASGEVDTVRYGSLLSPRGLVGLRGAGALHDGLYYVSQVTHTITRGSCKQRFLLAREGLGTTIPVVRT
ncbi:MAG: hypothetical protein PHV57_02650 [Methanomicrobiaceae archaeon]|nr:hypothetical protein [Methanomicrobiaceae archaeon]